MKGAVGLLVLMLAAVTAMPTSAETFAKAGMTPYEFADYAQSRGLQLSPGKSELYSDTGTNLSGVYDGIKYSVFFFCGNLNTRCASMKFYAYWSPCPSTVEMFNRENAWNFQERFTKFILTAAQFCVVDMDVALYGGVSNDYLDFITGMWFNQLRKAPALINDGQLISGTDDSGKPSAARDVSGAKISLNDVVGKLGTPSAKVTMSDGGTVLAYALSKVRLFPDLISATSGGAMLRMDGKSAMVSLQFDGEGYLVRRAPAMAADPAEIPPPDVAKIDPATANRTHIVH